MIRKETYTQNNLNPDICDEAILYADREPTEEELFYINKHSFDNAAAYVRCKGWNLIRRDSAEVHIQNAEKTKPTGKLVEGKICPQCGTLNDKYFQICGKCSTSLSNTEIVQVDESYCKPKELSEEERLKKRMEQIKKPRVVTVFLPLLLIPGGLAFLIFTIIEGGFFSIIFGLFCCIILFFGGHELFTTNLDNYKLAKSDLNAYKLKVITKQDAAAKTNTPEAIQQRKQEMMERKQKMLENEYQQAVASQQASEPWTVRYSTHPCPYCGHYKVRYAKWEDKQMSVAFWGMASSAIDKHYKCEWCKKMW